MRSLPLLAQILYVWIFFPLISTSPTYHHRYPTSQQCETSFQKDRIFVLTDIANEPDDTMSLIRLLVHSDMYQIEGIVSITSFWLPNATYPELIQVLVDDYAPVYSNLQSHSNSTFPTAEYLSSVIRSGPKVYGMQAIQALEAGGNLTEGAQLLIDAVDASTEPLYVQIWGGANTLATALWYINRTRPADIPSFTSKIRVYSISDQDDTGPWVRHYFPSMRWIASRHGFNQYPVATWTGISSAIVDVGGPNQDIVSQAWLTENIQQAGQLGSHYPDIAFIMEGDTPAQFFNYKTGLSNAEYPSWGGWGGRYTANPFSDYAQYSDATDTVLRINGRNFTTNHATIWRWRDAFQHEFAARMQWTLAPNGPDSNATHPPIIVLNGSCTQDAIDMSVSVGDTITLDASSTYSPDASASLTFHWFQYLEPSTWEQSVRWIPNLNFQPSDAGRVVQFEIPQPVGGVCVDPKDGSRVGSGAYSLFRVCPVMHVLLEVKDEAAKNPMTRYRRVLLRMRAYDNGTVVGG